MSEEVYRRRLFKLEIALEAIANLSHPDSPAGIVAVNALAELEQDRRRIEIGKVQSCPTSP